MDWWIQKVPYSIVPTSLKSFTFYFTAHWADFYFLSTVLYNHNKAIWREAPAKIRTRDGQSRDSDSDQWPLDCSNTPPIYLLYLKLNTTRVGILELVLGGKKLHLPHLSFRRFVLLYICMCKDKSDRLELTWKVLNAISEVISLWRFYNFHVLQFMQFSLFCPRRASFLSLIIIWHQKQVGRKVENSNSPGFTVSVTCSSFFGLFISSSFLCLLFAFHLVWVSQ